MNELKILKILTVSSIFLLVNDVISDHNINFLCITETWLCNDEYVSHINTHIPWDTGREGAVPAIFDSSLLINPETKIDNLPKGHTLSLSHLTWKTIQPVLLVVVCHVLDPYSELPEFSEFWSSP